MTELTFTVQGSAPDPYIVRFIRHEGRNLTATCTCPAGQVGQYCKHRFAILSGDAAGVIGDNREDVNTVKAWLSGSDVELALQALDEAERGLDLAKKRVSAAKKAVAKAMLD